MIREVKLSDAKAIVDIYNYYILNTNITFEEKQLTVDDMEERIIEKTAKHPWIVYERDGQVIGYAYLSGWHSRSAYRYSNEASIYLDSNEKGHGIGKELFGQLLEVSKGYGVHTILNIIFQSVVVIRVCKIDPIKTIKASILSTIILFGSEFLNVGLLNIIFKNDITVMFENIKIKTICGLPSLLIFAICISLYNLYMTKRESKCLA